MPLLDPFSLFTEVPSLSDAEAADIFSNSPIEFQPSVGVTGEISRRANQGFFGGLFDTGKEFLGFATQGLQFLEQFDAGVEQVFGEGFLPNNDAPPPAPQISLGPQVAGIPVVLLVVAGGGALWLASR